MAHCATHARSRSHFITMMLISSAFHECQPRSASGFDAARTSPHTGLPPRNTSYRQYHRHGRRLIRSLEIHAHVDTAFPILPPRHGIPIPATLRLPAPIATAQVMRVESRHERCHASSGARISFPWLPPCRPRRQPPAMLSYKKMSISFWAPVIAFSWSARPAAGVAARETRLIPLDTFASRQATRCIYSRHAGRKSTLPNADWPLSIQ